MGSRFDGLPVLELVCWERRAGHRCKVGSFGDKLVSLLLVILFTITL